MQPHSLLTKTLCTAALLGVAGTMSAGSAGAAILLQTDFAHDSDDVSVATLSNLVWTTQSGLTGPTSLTASGNLNNTSFFNTEDLFGAFVNVNNVTGWTTTVSVVVGANDVTLNNIVADVASTLGNLTGYKNVDRATLVSVEVEQGGNPVVGGTASFDSPLYNSSTLSDPSIDHTLTFASPLTLSANTTYDFTLRISEGSLSSNGNQAAFDNLTFNGTVVPEPGSLALLSLGGLLIGSRRRRG